jgi:hypothetical protein
MGTTFQFIQNSEITHKTLRAFSGASTLYSCILLAFTTQKQTRKTKKALQKPRSLDQDGTVFFSVQKVQYLPKKTRGGIDIGSSPAAVVAGVVEDARHGAPEEGPVPDEVVQGGGERAGCECTPSERSRRYRCSGAERRPLPSGTWRTSATCSTRRHLDGGDLHSAATAPCDRPTSRPPPMSRRGDHAAGARDGGALSV